jgi:hypothetical protein
MLFGIRRESLTRDEDEAEGCNRWTNGDSGRRNQRIQTALSFSNAGGSGSTRAALADFGNEGCAHRLPSRLDSMEETFNYNYTLGWYLVVFLDVQGQQEKFRQLRLPTTPEEYSTVEGVVKDTAGFVLGLRDVFRHSFERFKEGLTSKTIESPGFVVFSDSFVAFVELRNKDEHQTPNFRIFSALTAACGAMLTSLASKHALRGGIDVGLGTEMCPGEIYGTALAQAYLLESRDADYPRVLIGDGLWKYWSVCLEHFEKLTTPAAKKMQELIRREMEITSVDVDGKRILDYLGPGIAKILTPGRASVLVQPAYQFVLDQQERWLSEGNAKLNGRYANLRRYFESRLPLWISR